MSVPEWAEPIERWAQSIRSPGNRAAYRGALLAFVASAPELAPEPLVRWREAQIARGLAPATVRNRMTAVRSFVGWAQGEQLLSPERAAALLSVPLWQEPQLTAPRLITLDQLRALDRAADAVWPEDELRAVHAQAALRTLAGSGLRLGELCPARWADFRRNEDGAWVLAVAGHAGRRREVPVVETAAEALVELHAHAPASAVLLPALSKHRPARLTHPAKPTSAGAVRKTLARLAAAMAPPGAPAFALELASPEALRRSFALRFLSRGGTLTDLQALLGHQFAVTTSRYVGEPAGGPVSDPWA